MEPIAAAYLLEAAGLEVPEDLRYAADIVDEAHAFQRAPVELADVVEATIGRRIRPTDLPGVLRDRTAARLAASSQYDELDAVVAGARRFGAAAIVASAESILDALRPRFAVAGRTVKATLRPIAKKGWDGNPFESVESPERASALAELALIRDVRRLLSKAGYRGATQHETGAWYCSVSSRDDALNANQALATYPDPFLELALRGISLRLNDRDGEAAFEAYTAKKAPVAIR